LLEKAAALEADCVERLDALAGALDKHDRNPSTATRG
jgi:hypothetical protein